MQRMELDARDGDQVMEDADPYNKQKYSAAGVPSRRNSTQHHPSQVDDGAPSSAARKYSPMIASPASPYLPAGPAAGSMAAPQYTSYTPQQQQQPQQQQRQTPAHQTPVRPPSYSSNAQNYYASPPTSRSQHAHQMPSLQPTHPPTTSQSTPTTPYYDPGAKREANPFASPRLSIPDQNGKDPVPQFSRINNVAELQPRINAQPPFRRANPEGGFISPLQALTTHLPASYRICNPSFQYESSRNPRRVLTKPSKGTKNDGYDNEDSDYILYVNDILGSEETSHKNRYLILDVLGQGTFGQVVKCQNLKTQEVVAVKVVKNKTAYFNQSMMEVSVLDLLNSRMDKNDDHHILRLKDTFIHRQHLCLVFELLSVNLYELIKQNQFRGLSTTLVRVFAQQLLNGLCLLSKARLIHCDLKPENILLKNLESPIIKIIDFGSACDERQTVYTYIQSRFYRSPEVLLGLPYSAAIDMWSLGCIVVELFLGLPLFPGSSEYNQVSRITEMLGLPPTWMLEVGKQSGEFFQKSHDEFGRRTHQLKSMDQYAREHGTKEQPSKKYFTASTLPEIIKTYPMPRKGMKQSEMDREMQNRMAFIDFVHGLLNINPLERWTPQQARTHPFITQQKFTGPFQPQMQIIKTSSNRSPAPGLQQQQQAEAMIKQRAQVAQQQQQQQQQAAVAQAQQQYYNNSYPTSPLAQASPTVMYGGHPAQQQAQMYTPTHGSVAAGPPPYPTNQQSSGAYAPQQQQQIPMVVQPPPQAAAAAAAAGGYQNPSSVQQSLYAQAALRSGRQRASTLDIQNGIPPALQRVVSHLDPNAPIRLQPSPAYYAPPPHDGSGGGGLANNSEPMVVAGRRRTSRAGGISMMAMMGGGGGAAGGQGSGRNGQGGGGGSGGAGGQRNFVRQLEDRTLEEGGWGNAGGGGQPPGSGWA